MTEVHDYSGFQEVPEAADLKSLGRLIEALELAQTEAAVAQEEWERTKKIVRGLEEHEIPELMIALNTKTHETAGGLKVTLATKLRASMPKANKAQCFEWLIANGHSAVIKNTVSVSFTAGQQDKAEELARELDEKLSNVSQDMRVPPTTLTSVLGKDIQKGVDVPMALFGAYNQQRAVVTVKKSVDKF